MKELKTEKVDLFVSSGSFEELQERFKGSPDINGDIASYLSDKIDDLFREDKKFKEYIEIYSRLSGLKNFAMLEAETEELISLDQGYGDGKRVKRVQGWIDKQDGKYACLFLCVSGISCAGLESTKSLLFIPDQGVSGTIFSLFSPLYNHGHVDMYTIDYHLKEIKELSGLPLNKIDAAIKERRYKEWLRVSERIGGCSK